VASLLKTRPTPSLQAQEGQNVTAGYAASAISELAIVVSSLYTG
jgi:hypothetical protein